MRQARTCLVRYAPVMWRTAIHTHHTADCIAMLIISFSTGFYKPVVGRVICNVYSVVMDKALPRCYFVTEDGAGDARPVPSA